jgi:hypothetical protein
MVEKLGVDQSISLELFILNCKQYEIAMSRLRVR